MASASRTLGVALAAECALLHRRLGAHEGLASESLDELGPIDNGHMIERHGIQTLERFIDITMDLQVAGDVGARKAQLIG